MASKDLLRRRHYYGLKVLVIEEGLPGQLHSSLLTRSYCAVTLTATTSSALVMMQQDSYDSVLFDGDCTPELIAFIRDTSKFQPDSTVMIMIHWETFKTNTELVQEGSKNKAVGFLFKPVNADKLPALWDYFTQYWIEIGTYQKNMGIVISGKKQLISDLRAKNAKPLDGRSFMSSDSQGNVSLGWTPPICERLEVALEILIAIGAELTYLSDVLREMNVTNITARQVGSRLLTYRETNKRRRIDEAGTSVAGGTQEVGDNVGLAHSLKTADVFYEDSQYGAMHKDELENMLKSLRESSM